MRSEKEDRKKGYIYIFLYTKALYFEYLMSFSGTRMDDAFAEWTKKKPFPKKRIKYKRKEWGKNEKESNYVYECEREKVPSIWQAKCVWKFVIEG